MEGIKVILEFLNQIGPAITAAATVVIAALTYVLASENRKLRKAGTEPEVVAYLAPSPTGIINFVLANVGQGPAKEVRFEFVYEKANFEKHEVKLHNDSRRAAISYLPQGEKISSILGVGYKLARTNKDNNGEMLKSFIVKITYKNSKGKLFFEEQEIDICQFSGLSGIFAKSPTHEMVDSIKKMEKHLCKLAKNPVTLSNLHDATEIHNSTRKYEAGKSIDSASGDKADG